MIERRGRKAIVGVVGSRRSSAAALWVLDDGGRVCVWGRRMDSIRGEKKIVSAHMGEL
jgi:hypothetical protein